MITSCSEAVCIGAQFSLSAMCFRQQTVQHPRASGRMTSHTLPSSASQELLSRISEAGLQHLPDMLCRQVLGRSQVLSPHCQIAGMVHPHGLAAAAVQLIQGTSACWASLAKRAGVLPGKLQAGRHIAMCTRSQDPSELFRTTMRGSTQIRKRVTSSRLLQTRHQAATLVAIKACHLAPGQK